MKERINCIIEDGDTVSFEVNPEFQTVDIELHLPSQTLNDFDDRSCMVRVTKQALLDLIAKMD